MTALEHNGSPSAPVYGDALLLGERLDRWGVQWVPGAGYETVIPNLIAFSFPRRRENFGIAPVTAAENSEKPETPAAPERREIFQKSRTGAELYDGAGVSEDFDDLDGAAAEILSDIIPDLTLRSASARAREPLSLAE